MRLFECEKRIARTFAEVRGQTIGEVVSVGGGSVIIHGQGGFIVAHRVRPEGGQKIAADQAGLEAGKILGQ